MAEDSDDSNDSVDSNGSVDSNVRILTPKGLEFTWDLYRQSVAGNVENLFFSPLSISVALAMTLAGAKENTAEQMKDVLKLGSFTTDSAIHEAFHGIIDSLWGSQDSAIKLHIANRMYVHNNANILPDFRGVLKEHYNTSSTVVDFCSDAEKIRLEINKWVEEETQTKIKDLIPPLIPPILDNLTRLVLVNAIYFKGNWHQPFEPDRTNADNFYLDINKAVMTDFMDITAYFRYREDDNLNCRIIELPYVGEIFSMFAILPYDINGLKALEEMLTVSDLERLMNYTDRTEVNLILPKFKIESALSLKDILSSMGMSDLFNENKANLSGITGKKDLFVSAVLHKAFLEVNEEGSEAAASTAGMATQDCLEPEFRADHPFLLFIINNRSGAIMFWGRLINPNPGGAVQEVQEVQDILTTKGLEFTWDLYRQSVAGNVDNLFISPLSISVALAMTLAGAKKDTAKQMKDVLKLGSSFTTDTSINEAFHEIIDSILGPQDSAIKLHIANRMYVHNNTNILADFRGVLEEHYNTSSTVVDFGSDAEKIRLEINKWVEEQTQTKIKDLIPPGILDDLTRLVLVNAIYFKGNWHQPFEPDRTNADNFYLDDNKAVMTDFMHITSVFRYVEVDNLNCRIIELPYVGGNFSMFVILPYDINGLKALEETLTVSELERLMTYRYVYPTIVILSLPKFKIESSLSLKDILSSMGMSDLCNENKANLSGITGKKDLFVSAVFHKAFVEVSEGGSEASEPMITFCRGEFRADHPFLLFIKDNRSGAILFCGRLINPNPGAAVQEVHA